MMQSRGLFKSPLFMALVGAVIGGLLVAAAGFLYLDNYGLPSEKSYVQLSTYDKSNAEAAPSGTVEPTMEESATIAAVKKVGPAVVNIDTTVVQQTFWGLRSGQGTGSGVIIDSGGYIITNNHVVDDASNITVTLVDGRKFRGRLVGADSDRDIAVIKINAEKLPVAELGDSDKLQPGQLAIAIGNPYSFDWTVTTGVISALDRFVEVRPGRVMEGLIQTDAAINPGNSGGPLVNSAGQVIGINTLLFTGETGTAQGIGFALPINMVKDVAEAIISEGKTVEPTPWLGIYMTDLSSYIAERYGLPVREGVVIQYVIPDSPAKKAGLARGDIIVKANGIKVENTNDLAKVIKEAKIGDKLKLTILREGEWLSKEAVLE